MKLSVIGSVKINSRLRKKMFLCNLKSLSPISKILSWRLNIVGKYADFSKAELLRYYKNAIITNDDDSSYYQIMKDQIQNSQNDIVLFWEEDNWFLCPCPSLFFYLLSEFKNSPAEILTVVHLITSWETKPLLPVVKETYLYTEYKVDKESQKNVWQKYPTAYLAGITAIHKKKMALDILEFNRSHLEKAKNDRYFELDRQKGERFLEKRSFIEMIPNFQVFREVFRFQPPERAISLRKAMQILKLRGKGLL
jgi:hypothetical protein